MMSDLSLSESAGSRSRAMRLSCYCFALILVASLSGCVCPRLSRTEAISIAKRAAEQEGYSSTDYKKTVARYWLSYEPGKWQVYFYLTRPSYGGYFEVFVNDRTGETELFRNID